MTADFTTLCDEIAGMLRDLRRVIVALDGPDEAGIDRLADRLADHFDAVSVIRLRDFRLPDADPDGPDVDFARLTDEVADPLWRARTPAYHAASAEDAPPRFIACDPATTLYVVAGAFSHHPAVPDVYDLRVYVEPSADAPDTPPTDRRERIARYLTAYMVRQLSDLICAVGADDAYLPLPDEPRSPGVETVDMSALLPFDPKKSKTDQNPSKKLTET